MPRTRVKVCCIQSAAEAAIAIEAGADAIGLVSAMPSGYGPIDEETIAAIAAAVPPPIATFLLTSLTDVDAIVEQHRRCRTTALQLVDQLEGGEQGLQRLRQALPGVRLVQVVHVTGMSSIEQARALAPHAHALLLDSGNPEAAIKELGGTGRVHDWSISAAIVRAAAPTPVFLAGGLNPDNVYDAIREVRPFAVDVCTGVRSGQGLDDERVSDFCEEVAGVY